LASHRETATFVRNQESTVRVEKKNSRPAARIQTCLFSSLRQLRCPRLGPATAVTMFELFKFAGLAVVITFVLVGADSDHKLMCYGVSDTDNFCLSI
jgi:hypothetical protein